MQIATEGLLELERWTLRYRLPEGNGSHPVLLLIHGWTGDENVMWIFTQRLSPRYLILAPRGLYKASDKGYGWEPRHSPRWPLLEDFRPSVDALTGLLDEMANGTNGLLLDRQAVDFSDLNLMGFSQGAALAYTLALFHPQRVRRLAGLAGFLPEDAASLVGARPLQGKPVFMAHGRRDERVPVERARDSLKLLKQAGAEVSYCEEDVGHKLALSCFHELGEFFAI